MICKIYIKPKKLIGLVIKTNSEIIGAIHGRWNNSLNSYEIRRVFSKRVGLATLMYKKLLSLSKNFKFTNDRDACTDKAFSIWKRLAQDPCFSVIENNQNITLMDCGYSVVPLGTEIYLIHPDKDWFTSIIEFRVLYSLYLKKVMPLEPSLSYVSRHGD